MEMLSTHFSKAEFICKCGCGTLNVDPELLRKLELMRASLGGKPLSINSGCRCPSYNKRVKGAKNSEHITTDIKPCRAADIHAPLGINRYELVRAAFELGFTGIGVDNAFIHLDIRDKNPSLWHY